MNNIKANIENLTSLWQTASEPFNSYFKEPYFNYSFIKHSDWPNRLWFDQEVTNETVLLAKEKMASISKNLIIPYWDIYNDDSFKIIEKNGFSLKFEQIGMFLKRNQLYEELNNIHLKKVTTEKDAKLWSILFSKSFGYHLHPSILNSLPKNADFYIAYHLHEAIGTGILYTTNRISGIHAVGIIPEHRRKGYAEQIMKILINQSINMNSELITLQSSNMGKGLYLKLGFEEQFIMKNYALD
ncbi:GNAT family N-acetyltransferase [uncultured Kordia sp.]|uniref:GNAT family N-acetyltransferase n=1 Tax=uncultured Kordia sp. TaxID=507699 RepID=UPI00261DE022|nr:GNAT family N-acetyltransferase [uncultured Kordia sp.]